ncbi:MAG TPA: flavodoxin family protein [Candidatus Agathobaculum merdipullorum]|nr:flavodoxin family protein [Candidatus Agathobaculum merdipullorum]
MTYAIIYSSKTGNTRLLAETLRDTLPTADCLYFGEPSDEALRAERIYVGFWTDKGTCDADTAAFLARVTTQEVFLFGTAGFGGAPEYFDKILSAARQNLPDGVTVCGSYMCQGKMPMAVRARYEQMEDSPRRQMMIENFDAALSHPDTADLAHLRDAVLDR